ncbi:MAG TPA: adenylate/guanylate cyclase domain-containing protein [Oxalicibacterium sp.]|nr:adenylate/guanylate cyclase domain-containing protein [Oxalicibacterium sp.]
MTKAINVKALNFKAMHFQVPKMFRRKRGFRLHITITLVFVLLSLPVTIIFGVMTYRSNQQLIADHTDRFIQKSLMESAADANKLFGAMLNSVRTASTLMRDNSDYFMGDSSSDYLQEIVISKPGIYSAYVTFEDGSFHQVRRAIPGEQILGKAIPPKTEFVSRFIDASSGTDMQGLLIDSYTYQAPWGITIGQDTGSAVDDPRLRTTYKNISKLKNASISDPYVLSNLNKLGITISSPVLNGDRLLGIVAVDYTLEAISSFLSENRTTQNSMTIMLDGNGSIVAHPQYELGVSVKDEQPVRVRADKLQDPRVLAALGEHLRVGRDYFTFRAGPDDTEYLAVFADLPEDLGKSWETLTITPTNDFVGDIHRANRNMLFFSIGAFLLQIVLIYMISRMIARPIEQLASEVMHIREFRFDKMQRINSSIREIRYLSDAIALLERALQSFASYVPTMLVKQLLESEQGTKLGVESRFLTILFTDIEGFSSLSESEPSQRLLTRVSDYFATVTKAVQSEHGTVDKFIGDAVMAFWGAPKILENHAYLACVAAMRSQRGMAALNRTWAEEKQPPLKLRIGIHCDSVLVGNVGSTERISYTVMGDGVNVAARLEGLNKEMGTSICVSHRIFREAGHLLWLRPVDTVTVKGRKGELLVYELLGIRGEDAEIAATPDEIELCELTRTAYNVYASGDYRRAVMAYGKVLERFPQDQVAKRMLQKSRTQFNLMNDAVSVDG